MNDSAIAIRAADTLLDFEQHDRALAATTDAHVLLPADTGNHFFKDVRLIALLAGASARGSLSVQSDAPPGDSSLVDLARRIYATGVPTADLSGIAGSLAEKEGRLEHSDDTLTYCALDDYYPRPLALDAADSYEFARRFVDVRRRLFPSGKRRQRPFGEELKVGIFIAELFQNTFDHGRLDASNRIIIPALRFLRVRYHEAPVEQLVTRATGFRELERYLSDRPKTPVLRLYEVAISDHGLGILRRFLSTASTIRRPRTDKEKFTLLDEIVTRSLSSKALRMGAGSGLRRALQAASDLDAFVSLRTDSLWAYSSPERLGSRYQLKSTAAADLPAIDGTHFSLLVPLP